MFSNIGWGEIFFILVIGLIIIGPERLPGVVQDARAAIYAAKKAINNAKKELDGELEGFEELRQPLNTVTEYAAMGPRRAMAKVLFDGDEQFLDEFDPRKQLEDAPTSPAKPAPQGPRPRPAGSTKVEPGAQEKRGGGFSWADIT
ncbi:Sec-independent protein translocase protein TatB [Corynebacterium qintianiae]|uniref:Sec-independent protein translocase protein TatB n=1 Tax=Corynebacterium qintianiae TaxID=2709392 RepID=UPI0013EE0477|nr:Sec-independent protein translocase protein TatB [Corynebacterium qintianiae]